MLSANEHIYALITTSVAMGILSINTPEPGSENQVERTIFNRFAFGASRLAMLLGGLGFLCVLVWGIFGSSVGWFKAPVTMFVIGAVVYWVGGIILGFVWMGVGALSRIMGDFVSALFVLATIFVSYLCVLVIGIESFLCFS